MQFRRNHPWNGGYALPENVLAERPNRSTLTTKYLPRRTFGPVSSPPSPWKTGYSYPPHVSAEPVGHSPRTTRYLPRRTVMTKIPNYLDKGDAPAINKYAGEEWLTEASKRYDTPLDGFSGGRPTINRFSGEAWEAAAEADYGMGGVDTKTMAFAGAALLGLFLITRK